MSNIIAATHFLLFDVFSVDESIRISQINFINKFFHRTHGK